MLVFFRCGTCGGSSVKAMGAYRPRAIFFSALSLPPRRHRRFFDGGTGGNEAGISVTAFHHHHHHHLRGKLGCKLCCVVFRGTGYCVATCNAENSTCILTGFIHFLIATILFIDFRNLLSNCRKRGLLATIRCVRCLSTVRMLMFGTKRMKIPAQF